MPKVVGEPCQISHGTCGDTVLPKKSALTLPSSFKSLNFDTDFATAIDIENKTQDQRDCQMWLREHQDRITASNFGNIIFRKALPSEAFLTNLFTSFNKTIIAASITYGCRHEEHAKAKYLEVFAKDNVHLHKCGFVVNPEFSFLGATPDAKVCKNGKCGIMEIKCPFSCRNLTIHEAIETVNNFLLVRSDNGLVTLRTNHPYYAQVQGQLLITGTDFCEFVVYTQKDIHIETIMPDHCFLTDMLNKLCSFYKDYGKPYIEKQNLPALSSVPAPADASTSSVTVDSTL